VSALLKSNPKYRTVRILRVDWDLHGGSDITRELKVAHQSTLLMFRGGKEIGRVVAQTSQADIEPLFEAATR